MDSLRWTTIGIAAAIVIVIGGALAFILSPGTPPKLNRYDGQVQSAALLRVPVTGIYPGGNTAGLNPNMANPLAGDPDAVARGAKDFDAFNCSGCHMARGGGGMGPALSDNAWVYRSSPANIYLTIVQGRSAGMPAFGAMLPDRTVWELVAYIQSLSDNPSTTFGDTTSADPQMPNVEQVPAGRNDTDKPWQFTEPMPPNGEKSGSNP
jgi:cytochrome c oxidase cbb3-type subunit 3